MFNDPGLQAKVKYLSDKNKFDDGEVKIQLYKKQAPVKKVAHVNLNEHFSLNSFELNSDNLAKSIVNGIIGEIRTRSNSASRSSSSSEKNRTTPKNIMVVSSDSNLMSNNQSIDGSFSSDLAGRSSIAKISALNSLASHQVSNNAPLAAAFSDEKQKLKDATKSFALNIEANKKVLFDPIDKNASKTNIATNRKITTTSKKFVPTSNTVKPKLFKEMQKKNQLKPIQKIKLVSKLNREKVSGLMKPKHKVSFEGVGETEASSKTNEIDTSIKAIDSHFSVTNDEQSDKNNMATKQPVILVNLNNYEQADISSKPHLNDQNNQEKNNDQVISNDDQQFLPENKNVIQGINLHIDSKDETNNLFDRESEIPDTLESFEANLRPLCETNDIEEIKSKFEKEHSNKSREKANDLSSEQLHLDRLEFTDKNELSEVEEAKNESPGSFILKSEMEFLIPDGESVDDEQNTKPFNISVEIKSTSNLSELDQNNYN